MRCLNHPDIDAAGSCMFCRNLFCSDCLETVGEHRMCLDCIEAMAESSLAIREASFLTTKMLIAGTIFLVLGLAAAFGLTLHFITLLQLLFFSRGPTFSFPHELVNISFSMLKMLAYLVAGYGILMSRGWSYWIGIAVATGTLFFSLYSFAVFQNIWDAFVLTGSAAVLVILASGNSQSR